MSPSPAAVVEFDALVSTIESTTIARLPEQASAQLPSRGQVAVHGSVNGHAFQTVVEPDGLRGHWIRIDTQLGRDAGIATGDTINVALTTQPDWPEPSVPADLTQALAGAPPETRDLWSAITSMARWEWVRWVNATANPATRQRRVDVTISKLSGGKRRPCCFDLSSCTDPALARSGKLRAE